MHPNFSRIVETLHPSLDRLLQMSPVTCDSLPRLMPQSGIYLFTEHGINLYVGRSNRLKSRIRRHAAVYVGHNAATFAFKIARRETGKTEASYRSDGSRKNLLGDPSFAKEFAIAKDRIRKMEVRFVEETNQLQQAVLEIYAAVALGTMFNDFKTH